MRPPSSIGIGTVIGTGGWYIHNRYQGVSLVPFSLPLYLSGITVVARLNTNTKSGRCAPFLTRIASQQRLKTRVTFSFVVALKTKFSRDSLFMKENATYRC